MAFNVSSLSAYTKTNENMLLVRSFFSPKTASFMQKLPDVKSTIQVPNLDDVLVMQDGSSCGFNASGDTTISARVLTVGRIKVNKEWCVNDLETKYTQLLLAPGSYYEKLPGGIDQAFMETITGTLAEAIETAIWQGDTNSGDANLNKFDGLVKIIGAASGVIDANTATYTTGAPIATITVSNVRAVLDGVYSAIPAALRDKSDLKIFVGYDVAVLYNRALTAANLFHFVPPENAIGEFPLVGTNVMIVPVAGLNGTGDIYALRTSNMFLGFDKEGEEDNFKIWYSEDFDLVRFKSRFKYGVQVGRPNEIVKFVSSI